MKHIKKQATEMTELKPKPLIALSENEIDQQMKQVASTDNDLFSGFRAAPDALQKKLAPPSRAAKQS